LKSRRFPREKTNVIGEMCDDARNYVPTVACWNIQAKRAGQNRRILDDIE